MRDHEVWYTNARESNRQKELQLAAAGGGRRIQQYDDYSYDDVIQERSSMEDDSYYQ